jgi:hypothetical protein
LDLVLKLAKNTPSYDNLDPREGIWNPLGRPVYDEDDEPPEMEAETVDVRLWDILKDRGGRKRMREIPALLNSEQAKAFYRSVTANPPTKPFSQRGAQECGISRHRFNRYIFGALKARGLADWKDERHPRQGIDLTDEGIALLALRGNHSPLPHRRA